MLDELLQAVDLNRFAVAVGVNNSTDRTAEIARQRGVLVAETSRRGYGHGCQAAIDQLTNVFPRMRAYVFCAGDGASDPRDIARLAAAFDDGCDFVLGTRTTRVSNWRAMTFRHVIANLALGTWCGLLSGRFFTDLGPLRLIERELFETIARQEMTYGWTIEAQIGAAQAGASIREIPVHERLRIAGQQKVSGVSWHQTLSIGCRIVAAGYRSRFRAPSTSSTPEPLTEDGPTTQPQPAVVTVDAVLR